MVPEFCRSRIIWLPIALWASGCGPRAPVESPHPLPEAPTPVEVGCTLVPGKPDRFRVLRIAVTEPVEPAHAPVPVNDAEALVFRQAYETLVRLDCEKNVLPL